MGRTRRKGLNRPVRSLGACCHIGINKFHTGKITLHGLNGAIKVNGKDFGPEKGTPPMTRFNELLNDEEVAAVLTYVRNSWGNQGEVVKPEKVAEVRKANAKRFQFWDSNELLKAHPLKK